MNLSLLHTHKYDNIPFHAATGKQKKRCTACASFKIEKVESGGFVLVQGFKADVHTLLIHMHNIHWKCSWVFNRILWVSEFAVEQHYVLWCRSSLVEMRSLNKGSEAEQTSEKCCAALEKKCCTALEFCKLLHISTHIETQRICNQHETTQAHHLITRGAQRKTAAKFELTNWEGSTWFRWYFSV